MVHVMRRVQYSFQVCLRGGQKQIIELGPFTDVYSLHMRPGAGNELVGFKNEEHGPVLHVPVEWFDPTHAHMSVYRALVAQKFSKPSMMPLEFTNQNPDTMIMITGVLSGGIQVFD